MDNMWLFSTYLSNAIGHLFSLLPGDKTLLGMNIGSLWVRGICQGHWRVDGNV